MGYLAQTIASLRSLAQATGVSCAPALWCDGSMAEWLVLAPPSFAGQRAEMIKALRAQISHLAGLLGTGAIDRALQAMAKVPRECFICPWIEDLAYLPMAHDIGLEQIISRPDLAAILAAAVNSRGRVLDVGTGCGYQAAVLAGMADRVVSVEILEPLARQARHRLAKLGYANVDVHTGDASALVIGTDQFEPESFDGIVVAAGSHRVPTDLLTLLTIGGRLIMPLGSTSDQEQLVLVEKIGHQDFRHTPLCPAKFVPLTGAGSRHDGSMSGWTRAASPGG